MRSHSKICIVNKLFIAIEINTCTLKDPIDGLVEPRHHKYLNRKLQFMTECSLGLFGKCACHSSIHKKQSSVGSHKHTNAKNWVVW